MEHWDDLKKSVVLFELCLKPVLPKTSCDIVNLAGVKTVFMHMNQAKQSFRPWMKQLLDTSCPEYMLSENKTAYGEECPAAWTVFPPVILPPAAWETVCGWCVWRISPEHWLSHKAVQFAQECKVKIPDAKTLAGKVSHQWRWFFPASFLFFFFLWLLLSWMCCELKVSDIICSTKIEKEKKEHARQHGMIRTEISGAEIAEEMEKERRFFQLQMCEVSLIISSASLDSSVVFFLFICPDWETKFQWKTNLFNVFTVSP